MLRTWTVVFALGIFVTGGFANECVPRSFGKDKIVCVCNATYCDGTPDNNPKIPENGSFYWYVSTKEGLRLSLSKEKIGDSCHRTNSSTVLKINTTQTYQKIFGYGGAFTDSVGINIKKLSQATQEQLMRAYYDPTVGSRYVVGRIPIAGTDFSTRAYTYDDVANDTSLSHFALTNDDYKYKIPFIKKALELNPEMKFFASSWSAPPWMKTNDRINGLGFLKEEYYQTYTDYLLKFMDEYTKNGINLWGITTGNEPLNAFIPGDTLNTMGWTPDTVSTWIANNLGPSIAASKHNGTLILALDDQRIELPWYIQKVFKNKKAEHYVAGTAVHWYTDFLAPPTVLDETHDSFPNKFLFLTEACTGSGVLDHPKVDLGSWERGEKYILSIIQYMNHWSIGWTDWNIALDRQGGPNWIRNYVDAPIIVNPETDEFYKQPMYYALKHFSRFVDRGSWRTSINETDHVKATAFVTPSKEVVVILYNKENTPENVELDDVNRGSICLELPPYSMNTVIYAQ